MRAPLTSFERFHSFVDGSPENTQLSQVARCTKRARGARRRYDTTALSSKKAQGVALFSPNFKCLTFGVLSHNEVSPSPSQAHAFCQDKCCLYWVACSFYLHAAAPAFFFSFTNLDSRSWNDPAPSTAVSQSQTSIPSPRYALANHCTPPDSGRAPCNCDWRESHFIQSIA